MNNKSSSFTQPLRRIWDAFMAIKILADTASKSNVYCIETSLTSVKPPGFCGLCLSPGSGSWLQTKCRTCLLMSCLHCFCSEIRLLNSQCHFFFFLPVTAGSASWADFCNYQSSLLWSQAKGGPAVRCWVLQRGEVLFSTAPADGRERSVLPATHYAVRGALCSFPIGFGLSFYREIFNFQGSFHTDRDISQ